MAKTQMKKVSESYSKFEVDWKALFHWIKGQICPEALQRLMRSDEGTSIVGYSHPGGLMKLL